MKRVLGLAGAAAALALAGCQAGDADTTDEMAADPAAEAIDEAAMDEGDVATDEAAAAEEGGEEAADNPDETSSPINPG